MKVTVSAEFGALRPLSQQTGLEFWSHGSYFGPSPGPRQYRFVTDGESDSITDAIEATETIILSLVHHDGHNAAEITKIEAEVLT